MGGTRQPFIYEAVTNDERFPASTFDPKAVTRSSYESKNSRKQKTKRNGPLISVNRHPEYVDAPLPHSSHKENVATARTGATGENAPTASKIICGQNANISLLPARTWCPTDV